MNNYVTFQLTTSNSAKKEDTRFLDAWCTQRCPYGDWNNDTIKNSRNAI